MKPTEFLLEKKSIIFDIQSLKIEEYEELDKRFIDIEEVSSVLRKHLVGGIDDMEVMIKIIEKEIKK